MKRALGEANKPTVQDLQMLSLLGEHPGLFDASWYLRQLSPGECPVDEAPRHFVMHGRHTNLSPGPWLDPAWYWQEYADVAATGQSAFDHYVLHGEKEGRQPHPELLLEISPRILSEAAPLDPTSVAWAELVNDPDFRVYFSNEERFRDAFRSHPNLFAPDWYLTQLPEGLCTADQALEHFMSKGRDQNLAPGPWLDPTFYWQEYPDVALTGQCAFDHYALHGEQEGRWPRRDFTPRLALAIVPSKPASLSITARAWEERCAGVQSTDPSWLLEELHDAWSSETQLAAITPEHLWLKVRGTHSTYLQPYVERVLDGFVEDSFLILVPHFMLGGADRVAANVAAVAAEVLGSDKVCVVSTDRGDTASMKWFADGVTLRVMQPTRESRLDEDELGKVVADLLMAGRPRAVLNINSRAGWLTYSRYGRQLSQQMSLMATQFCRDFHDYGGFGGYGDEFLRDSMGYLSLVMLDNARYKHDLVTSLGLLEGDAAKMQVVYQPSNIPPSDLDMTSRNTDNVLWLGRIADQKRPDLLAEVAGLVPDKVFNVFGGPTDSETVRRYGLDHDNIVLHGPIANIQQLNPLDYGALLFTSAYEGLPNVPIEVGAWGLPIVASAAGGLPELIDAETGWLLSTDAKPSAYAEALLEAMRPTDGAVRGLALRTRVSGRHTWDQLKRRLCEIGMFDGIGDRRASSTH